MIGYKKHYFIVNVTKIFELINKFYDWLISMRNQKPPVHEAPGKDYKQKKQFVKWRKSNKPNNNVSK